MRYAKDHKSATRAKIMEVAGRMFRDQGIANSGIAPMMSEAGLSPGSLYLHFSCKDALISQILDDGVERTKANVSAQIEAARRENEPLLGRMIDAYLSEYHLESIGIACVFASLGSEIRQQSNDARTIVANGLDEVVEIIATALPEGAAYKAAPLFALLAGTLQMAWTATTREERVRRLEDGRRAARDMIGAG